MSYVGKHKLNLKVSSSNFGKISSVTNSDYSYNIELKNEPCRKTTLTAIQIKDMEGQSKATAPITQTFLPIYDSLCPTGAVDACCRSRVYELVDADKYIKFFNFSEIDGKFTLSGLTDDYIGQYKMEMKVSLKNWTDVKAITLPFNV